MAYQPSYPAFGNPTSAIVGISCSGAARCAPVTARPSTLPPLMRGVATRTGAMIEMHAAGHEVGERFRRAAVRHVDRGDAGRQLEELRAVVRAAAESGGGEVELSRLLARERDQLLDRLRPEGGRYDEDERRGSELAHAGKIARADRTEASSRAPHCPRSWTRSRAAYGRRAPPPRRCWQATMPPALGRLSVTTCWLHRSASLGRRGAP